MSKNKKGTKLSPNVAAALCYLLGVVTGLIFYFYYSEDDEFVRFHSVQSIAIFGFFGLLYFVLRITIILSFLLPIINLISLILQVVLIIKAYQGKRWQVPFSAPLTEIVSQILGSLKK